MNPIGVIIFVVLAAFIIWQSVLLVRDIKAKKKNKTKKGAETSAPEQQTGVGSTQLEDHNQEK